MRAYITPARVLYAAVGAVIMLLALGGDGARMALRYERAMLPVAEVWRWLTGHLVHLTWGHALLNLAGLILILLLFERRLSAAGWAVVLLLSALAIDVGLWFFEPQLTWYVGLSGTLHGLFVAGALAELVDGRRGAWLLLLALVAKLVFEQTVGALPMTAASAGGPVVVDAHLYGTLGGALAYGLMRGIGGRPGARDQ